MKTIFISGTDTNVGKTYVTHLLLNKFNRAGYKTFGMKPIASGCVKNSAGQLENEDALILQAADSLFKPYHLVNPIALHDPIAPHLAAANMGIMLSAEKIKNEILMAIQPEADINVIEGVGGWAVPLNEHELFADVIADLKIPVILVVAIKLGCLNHAILTSKHIQQMQVPFIGWIANCIEPATQAADENIAMLKQWIAAPLMPVCQLVHLINKIYA